MVKTITVRWEFMPADPPGVLYYVDDSPIGENDHGFQRVLDVIRSHKDIEVTLKIAHISSLGGSSLEASLPFGERFNDLKEALGTNRLIYDFF